MREVNFPAWRNVLSEIYPKDDDNIHYARNYNNTKHSNILQRVTEIGLRFILQLKIEANIPLVIK